MTQSVIAGSSTPALSECRFGILDVELLLRSDDPAFLDEFRSVFHTDSSPAAPRARLVATVTGDADSGSIVVTGDTLESPADFLLSFSSPTIPIREVRAERAGDRLLAVGNDDQPLFRFQDQHCEFRKRDRWRRILSHYLFLRALRFRSDLLLFHAGSVGLAGHGMMIVGPKGSGKTTLSLALATRGWHFLGDEMAAYDPSNRMLLPFRRPVGIKPGPRAEAIDEALRRKRPRSDEDGIVRASIGEVCEVGAAQALPLRSVIFLQSFRSQPQIAPIAAGRDELSLLQPIATSLSAASRTQRVFEMAKLLSSVNVYRLTPGGPDATADLVERTFKP